MAKPLAIIESNIVKMAAHERDTKAMVSENAMDCLEYLHEHGQAAVCNKMLLALSPANKRAVFAFFKEYSGFIMDKEEGMKKKIVPTRAKDGTIDKDRYADSAIAFKEFKEQGSNLWLWFAAYGKKEAPEASPLDLNKVAKMAQGWSDKAEKQGIKRLALFNALVGGVFEAQEVADMLAELAKPRVATIAPAKVEKKELVAT